jgi:hypothetical protein
VQIGRAYRALAQTFRVEAEKEPTNPYNILKEDWQPNEKRT